MRNIGVSHPNILIRTDASVEIGTGHLVRCLALADALAAAGAAVRFLCRTLPQTAEAAIRERGHELRRLPPTASFNGAPAAGDPPQARWLGCTYEQDADATLAAIADRPRWDWLIVDHYSLDARWEQRLRPAVGALMVIDDLADRPHVCQVLLDQNRCEPGSGPYAALVPSDCRVLLGARFALLRPEFRAHRQAAVVPRTELRRLLIFFGGVDQLNLSSLALAALQRLARRDLRADVVVGALNPHAAEVAACCRSMSNVEFHGQTNDMAGLMARADLAVGAAGSASWERCCLGLPAIVGWVAANQRAVASTLARHRAAINLGDLSELTAAELAALLEQMSQRPGLLANMSARAAGLVDGGGIARVCVVLLKDEAVSIRPASAADAELAWTWRNAEVTRSQSFDPAPIPLAGHLLWWGEMLASSAHTLILGCVAGMRVGVVRFDMSAPVAQISIYLDPDMTGFGIGSALLRAALTWLRQSHPEIRRVEAFVKQDNLRSRRAFLAAGFHWQSTCLVWTCADSEHEGIRQ